MSADATTASPQKRNNETECICLKTLRISVAVVRVTPHTTEADRKDILQPSPLLLKVRATNDQQRKGRRARIISLSLSVQLNRFRSYYGKTQRTNTHFVTKLTSLLHRHMRECREVFIRLIINHTKLRTGMLFLSSILRTIIMNGHEIISASL